ncbi:MAG: hypothetical protein MJ082_03725 [Clostridia bacterium]|nr:hypothetical protein [Clostridia bacterium]
MKNTYNEGQNMAFGSTIPSQMKTFTDPVSGRKIVKLTKEGINWHFYFTDNSFLTGDKAIYYFHADGDPHSKLTTELYKMDLETGISTQISDLSSKFGTVSNFTKSPDGELIAFVGDNDLYALDPHTGENRLRGNSREP